MIGVTISGRVKEMAVTLFVMIIYLDYLNVKELNAIIGMRGECMNIYKLKHTHTHAHTHTDMIVIM